MKITRQQLLEAGVRNLKEFGYPDVTTENVATDYVYRQFFKRMLEDTLEKLSAMPSASVDLPVKQLLKEIETLDKKEKK